MFRQFCPLQGRKCTCDQYDEIDVKVNPAEFRDYLLAQFALALSPPNVWRAGEKIKDDPRKLSIEDEVALLWDNFVKSGGAKQFAEAIRRGQTTIKVCRHLVVEQNAA